MGTQNTPALLFRHSINIQGIGASREECLSTGRYLLQDVCCRQCCSVLGWQYLQAEAADQKYKETCLLLVEQELEKVDKTVASPVSATTTTTNNSNRVTTTATTTTGQAASAQQ